MANRYVVIKGISGLRWDDSIYKDYEGAVHALVQIRGEQERKGLRPRTALNGSLEVLNKDGEVVMTYDIETRAGFAEGEYNG